MRKGTKYAATVTAALLGLGAASASASANIVAATGGPGFSGLSVSSTGHTFTVTGGGGTMVMSCANASFGGINGVGDMNASFSPTYTGCTADISGIQCEIVLTTPGSWTFSQGAPKTGGWSAFFTLNSAAKLEFNDSSCGMSPADCTINFPVQSVTGTSVLAANATASRVKVSGTLGGISWNSSTPNCGMGTGAANGTYSINGSTGITIPGIKLT